MRTVSRFASGVGGWEEQTLPHRMWQHITTKAMSVCCSLAALECSATGHAFGALHHCRVLVLVRQIRASGSWQRTSEILLTHSHSMGLWLGSAGSFEHEYEPQLVYQ